jgi:hypothetical protein
MHCRWVVFRWGRDHAEYVEAVEFTPVIDVAREHYPGSSQSYPRLDEVTRYTVSTDRADAPLERPHLGWPKVGEPLGQHPKAHAAEDCSLAPASSSLSDSWRHDPRWRAEPASNAAPNRRRPVVCPGISHGS